MYRFVLLITMIILLQAKTSFHTFINDKKASELFN